MAQINRKLENVKAFKGFVFLLILFGLYWTTFHNKHVDKSDYKKMTELINVGNFTYSVDNVNFYRSVGNYFVKRNADGVFLVVSLRVMNRDNTEHSLDNSLFKLTDENGAEYEISIEGSTALELTGHQTLFMKQLNPNIWKDGFLIFEVPRKNANLFYLHLSGGFLNLDQGVVELK